MRSYFSFIFITILIVGCSSDNSMLDEPTTVIEYQYLKHNQWIYEQMNRNYLWRFDLPDSIDCDYGLTPPDFFKSLLSDKDRFSYITTNSSYNPTHLNHLGFEFQEYKDRKGQVAIQVLYVTNNSLKKIGVKRGDFYIIKNKDNSNLTLYKVALNEKGYFVNTFCTIDLSNTSKHPTSTVIKDSIYYKGDKRIGYLCYSKFDKESDLHNSLTLFKNNNITDLVLDLRYNPGGYVSTCLYLCNCLVSESGYGNVFQQNSYNDILTQYYYQTTGKERTYSYYKMPNSSGIPTLGIGIIPLNLSNIYVLTSSHTASASEATIICLQPYTKVVVIGETTIGKGVGSINISDSKFKYSLQPIIMRYYNAEGTTIPDTGIIPDYYMPNGYSTIKQELGDEKEPLLKVALDLISGYAMPMNIQKSKRFYNEGFLIPIGEPSYVTKFNNQRSPKIHSQTK